MTHPVERALQDKRRGHLVYQLRAAATRRIGVDQRARDRRCRESLVPKCHGEIASPGKIAREGAGRLRRRTFAAVHVERQSDDKAADAMLADDRLELRRIEREFAACEGRQRRSDRDARIGKRKPDRLFTEIEPQQARTRLQRRPQALEVDDAHRLEARSPISMRLPAGSRTKKRLSPSATPSSSIVTPLRRTDCFALARSETRKQTCRLLLGEGSGSMPM